MHGRTEPSEGPELAAVAQNLSPATQYTCRVVAANAIGPSSAGEEAIFTTTADRPAAPQPPVLKQQKGNTRIKTVCKYQSCMASK